MILQSPTNEPAESVMTSPSSAAAAASLNAVLPLNTLAVSPCCKMAVNDSLSAFATTALQSTNIVKNNFFITVLGLSCLNYSLTSFFSIRMGRMLLAALELHLAHLLSASLHQRVEGYPAVVHVVIVGHEYLAPVCAIIVVEPQRRMAASIHCLICFIIISFNYALCRKDTKYFLESSVFG